MNPRIFWMQHYFCNITHSSWDGPHGNGWLCSWSGWSGSSEEKDEAEVTLKKRLCDLMICVWVCIFKGRYSYFFFYHRGVGGGNVLLALLVFLTNQQSPSVVMTTSTSLLPISSSAVARETRSASAWWQASHKSSRTPVGLGFVAK